jgi:hypothetical protein
MAKKYDSLKKTAKMAPHHCTYKLNTIIAPPKTFSPTSTFEIVRDIMLQHILKVIVCKMASLSIVEASTTTDDLAHSQSKARKGKKIVVDEEQQLCRSFLHISQDSVIANWQKFAIF